MKQLRLRFTGPTQAIASCVSETKRATTALLDAWRKPSLLQRLRRTSGDTPANKHGEGTMENTSRHGKREYFAYDAMPTAQKKAFDRARRFGTLLYADGFLMAYNYKGDLYVMEPPPALRDFVTESLGWDAEQRAAHSEEVDDRAVPPPVGAEEWASDYQCPITQYEDELIQRAEAAVREAGFATEPHRHLIERLHRALKKRLVADGILGFTEEEWSLCDEAEEFLAS